MKNLFKTTKPKGEKVCSASPVSDRAVAYAHKQGKEYKTCLCINNRIVHKKVFPIAYSAMKQMKLYAGLKMILILFVLGICTTSCSQYADEDLFTASRATPMVYSEEISTTINTLYNICVEVYGEDIPQNIINDKLETIRFCDLVLDPYGDFVCELDGYELIEDILWPNGYGN